MCQRAGKRLDDASGDPGHRIRRHSQQHECASNVVRGIGEPGELPVEDDRDLAAFEQKIEGVQVTVAHDGSNEQRLVPAQHRSPPPEIERVRLFGVVVDIGEHRKAVEAVRLPSFRRQARGDVLRWEVLGARPPRWWPVGRYLLEGTDRGACR